MRFVWFMARREMRASWQRLLFFFVCIAVGVGAIVALRSVIQSVRLTFAGEARSLMTADVVISNGVINLSFRKRKVVEELFRIVKPGGWLSFTDIVSAKQLSQTIVNDPKLWAS